MVPSDTSRRTRAEIAAETREAILSAACEIISEEGFESIRMRMVAERAGVSTAALHYHFDNREKLFAAALRYSFENTGRDIYQANTAADTATARLARVISASLPTTVGLRREWAMYQELWCRAIRDPESRALAIELDRAQQDWIAETLADGVASGEFELCDIGALARMISALCDGFGGQLMLGNPSLTIDSVRAAIWEQASGALGIADEFPEDLRR
ncbi:TetR/AcrR family transcriptional regulator [Mycobacterium montefiorense]|uniref:TetR/AcrR family transcriptional regulator n=1 Tax=Mycobacterium montefiorense TaxID=154654 RepID=UPI0021DD1DAD|nr:TetR family transcriptional regulator C-terminal domain-containing protein [Mycobacterium montefiorense]MCV7428204.1 TetR/AcrR family transcriptional regulator [Mycobacterium montefiorense]GLE53167.1 transcriptional regulator [Mycobacterium montefiorense]